MMVIDVVPSYFSCTLGQAAQYNSENPHDFETINEFIDVQDKNCPQAPAVGFAVPKPKGEQWDHEIYTFRQLKRGSEAVAKSLSSFVPIATNVKEQPCVGLICPSTVDFIFTWLGLIRAGFSVLLIAPQCQPDAIAHLCRTCKVSMLFYGKTYSELGQSAASGTLKIQMLPWQIGGLDSIQHLVRRSSGDTYFQPIYQPNSQSVAYIHHTSGTSTGLPKPIPQTHHAGVGVLPCLNGALTASFTTTPLYHGGVADCFRAWTSGALIWLFPGDIPITSANIGSAIAVADRTSRHPYECAPVKYFSSVPYILQMLAQDEAGLEWLRSMDIVGVGGAALPDKVGAELTSNGIHLISRFGSAECGFLLSSHRDYSVDQAWQYLRASDSRLLKFEQHNDGSGLSELVIMKGWPHMAKTNRDDGSFATSDLFEPHPDIRNAWRYHSRSDSQITLVTGKKFDPAPVEDAIAASEKLIKDVMVFGNGRQVPGVLVFVTESAKAVDESELRDRIFKAVETINEKGQDHTRISEDMIVVMKSGLLEKSSKGTVLRKAAEETFAEAIETAYTGDEGQPSGDIRDEDVEDAVRSIIQQAVGLDMELETDFYQYGIDSAKATRIRTLLQKKFCFNQGPLPWNVVYDCGNVKRLSQYMLDRRQGSEATSHSSPEDEMLKMVEQYSRFELPNAKHETKPDRQVIILTGATGSLGSHILQLLAGESGVSKIYCLVRSKSDVTARERVVKALTDRQLPWKEESSRKVHCISCELDRADLGLSADLLQELIESVTGIIHTAWPVNFSLNLHSFQPSLHSLQNLLNLTFKTAHRSTLLFCSSTASVLGPRQSHRIHETVSDSPSESDTLGYSRSKWVAEAICKRAIQMSTDREARIKILRIGQLTGNTETGVWNMSEAFPLMLSTANVLGCLPRIDDCLDWLPVDIAAKATVEILNNSKDNDNGNEEEGEEEETKVTSTEDSQQDIKRTRSPIYHLVNNSEPAATFLNLLHWLPKSQTTTIETVEPKIWLEKLESLERHPAKALLGLWNRAYGGELVDVQVRDDEVEVEAQKVVFDTSKVEVVSGVMRHVEPVGEDLVGKIWGWLQGEIGKGLSSSSS